MQTYIFFLFQKYISFKKWNIISGIKIFIIFIFHAL